MNATAEDEILQSFDALINDADRHATRVAELKLNDNQKREFAANEMKSNVWPFLGAMARTMRDAWLDHEEALSDLLEGEGSVVQPELAAMILANLEAGVALVTRVRKLKVNDILRKELEGLCAAYENTARVVDKAVADAAVEPEPEEEEGEETAPGTEPDGGEEDDGEEEEEDDDDDGEATTPGGAV